MYKKKHLTIRLSKSMKFKNSLFFEHTSQRQIRRHRYRRNSKRNSAEIRLFNLYARRIVPDYYLQFAFDIVQATYYVPTISVQQIPVNSYYLKYFGISKSALKSLSETRPLSSTARFSLGYIKFIGFCFLGYLEYYRRYMRFCCQSS